MSFSFVDLCSFILFVFCSVFWLVWVLFSIGFYSLTLLVSIILFHCFLMNSLFQFVSIQLVSSLLSFYFMFLPIFFSYFFHFPDIPWKLECLVCFFEILERKMTILLDFFSFTQMRTTICLVWKFICMSPSQISWGNVLPNLIPLSRNSEKWERPANIIYKNTPVQKYLYKDIHSSSKIFVQGWFYYVIKSILWEEIFFEFLWDKLFKMIKLLFERFIKY